MIIANKEFMAKNNEQIIFAEESSRSEEMNYKKNFCLKYFDKDTWDFDVLKEVDIHLKKRNGKSLLYIEAKHKIFSDTKRRRTIAQVILTNHKQESILDHVAIIYQNKFGDDVLEYIDCSGDSVMYNNDINWDKEKPSDPSTLAINSINDRLYGRITEYRNENIKEFYNDLKRNKNVQINITEKNVISVFKQWKECVKFRRDIKDEQDMINLFLVDLLNGTKYHDSVLEEIKENTLFGSVKKGEKEVDSWRLLINEGTNLYNYEIKKNENGVTDAITYVGTEHTFYYAFADPNAYDFFWKTYHRPPEKKEFLKILERSSKLYTEQYRRDSGSEYTPPCFVELQNQILAQHYNMDDFIVCDPCAGVGNLENQFGKDYKDYCYLSTLESTDVDICKIKGFANAIQFDYLIDNKQPKWKYKGNYLPINEIAKLEGRKLMIIMNPPYQNKKEYKYNTAIEFFNKCLNLNPDVIVFYYETKSFYDEEVNHYVKSGYKIVSHVFTNAEVFLLSNWPISQIIFDKENGCEIANDGFIANRYEYDKKDEKLHFVRSYHYDFSKSNLFVQLKTKISENATGLILGNYSYLNDVIKIGNGGMNRGNYVTTENLKYCLLSKGLIFNTHHKYFELNSIVYRGDVDDIPYSLFTDAIMFSLFYKGILFTNKETQNYIMPFTANELECNINDLNVLIQNSPDMYYDKDGIRSFDFREYLKQFTFSEESKDLYEAGLAIFKYYHRSNAYDNKDYNDSFYDITNAIMGKDLSTFKEQENIKGKKITKVKTTKGSLGFSRNNIKSRIPKEDLPIFYNFFDVRERLAQKINQQLIENNLLLWERENIW